MSEPDVDPCVCALVACPFSEGSLVGEADGSAVGEVQGNACLDEGRVPVERHALDREGIKTGKGHALIERQIAYGVAPAEGAGQSRRDTVGGGEGFRHTKAERA